MSRTSDGAVQTLSPLQQEVLNVLDHRFWPGPDIEAALRIDTTTGRVELYSALGLLRRAGLVSDVPSEFSGRLYMISERGMLARHDGRLRQLQILLEEEPQHEVAA